ncbi:MAG: dephospho-CoA kinase [Moraxella sp.]|nr:dephospho-CoA kinase [Moraxella sp.]
MIVGLTGGIGSGKTAVSDWFAAQDICIIDADVISHQITQKNSPTLHTIVKAFGAWVLDETGNYSRAAMRAYIFSKPDELKKLNAITHPAIREETLKQLARSISAYTILSAPLLLESRNQPVSLFELCHRILVVDIPIELQIKRAAQRDGNPNIIQSIINRQISRDERLSLADDIIDNSGSLDELHAQLQPLHDAYLALASQKYCNAAPLDLKP